jgi:lipopolysaccharide export system protein LptC
MDKNTPAFDHHIRALSTRAIGGWRDQFGSVLKWALPLGSLALLMVMILWPMLNSQRASFILSKQGIEPNNDVLRMQNPNYRGRDNKGRPFVISASRAMQKDNNNPLVELIGLQALLTVSEGQAQVRAEHGIFDMKREQLRIAGKISVERADGYTFNTRDALLDLPTRVATGNSGVTGETPVGSFYAKSFRVNVESGLVVFTGGVKMRITPKRS